MQVFQFLKLSHAAPPGGRLNFSENTELTVQTLLNISRSIWTINLKFCRYIGTYQGEVKFYFAPNQKSNMAARRPSWIFISIQYLKKRLSNWFEIWHIYWYLLDKGQVRFWTWSEIQYGSQATILDFCFRSISREAFEQSIWNFAGLLVHIRRRSRSIFHLIGNPIWLPSSHLGLFVLNISRSVWAIDLNICRFIGTD